MEISEIVLIGLGCLFVILVITGLSGVISTDMNTIGQHATHPILWVFALGFCAWMLLRRSF